MSSRYERLKSGELTQIMGTAFIGRGLKSHRAYRIVETATGRVVDLDSDCMTAQGRSIRSPQLRSFAEKGVRRITCLACGGSMDGEPKF